MSQTINTKSLSKQYYQGYHQDGLLDIFLGLGIIFSVAVIKFGFVWFVAILPAIFWPLWMSAKEAITAPRLVGSQISQEQVAQGRTAILGFTSVGFVALILGLVVFWIFSTDSAPAGLNNWLRENFLIAMGVIGSFILALAALLTRITRYYAYALLAFLAGVGGPLLDIRPLFYTIAFGLIMLLSGLVILLRFTRTHPR